MGIKEAQLSNNSLLAEISYNTLKESLELSLQGFQYKNSLLKEQLQMENETEDRYYSRWKDVLEQINTENALEEQKRQFNLSLANSGSGGYDFGSSDNSAGDPIIYGIQSKFVNDYVNIYDENGNLIDRAKVYETDDGRQNQRWYFDGTTGTYKVFNGSVARKTSYVDTKNKVTSNKSSKTTVDKKSIETKKNPFPRMTF